MDVVTDQAEPGQGGDERGQTPRSRCPYRHDPAASPIGTVSADDIVIPIASVVV